MRRLTAISALLLLLYTWSAPLLAAATGAGSNLPACCRRAGKHHCMMGDDAMPVNTTAVFSAPRECCPLLPKTFFSGAAGVHLFTAPAGELFYSAAQSHPAVFAQTEAHYRIACDRARLKRGPPSLL